MPEGIPPIRPFKRIPRQPEEPPKTILPEGVSGMGVAGEAYGEPITNYYFEGAVDALIQARTKEGRNEYAPELRRSLEENRTKPNHIAVTDEGKRELLDKIDVDELRANILRPRHFEGKRIKSEDDGALWKYSIGGKPFWVKLLSKKREKRRNTDPERTGLFFPTPDFTIQLCLAKRIATETQAFPLHHVRISSITQYAAGKNFLITEPWPSISFADLLRSADVETFWTRKNSRTAQQFMREHNITVVDLEAAKKDLETLRKAQHVLSHTRHTFFAKLARDHVMLSSFPDNFFVKGFDASTRDFDLVLIDRSMPTPASTDHALDLADETADLQGAQMNYDELISDNEWRSCFEKLTIFRPGEPPTYH